MLLISRNDPNKHPMLSQVIVSSVDKKRVFFKKIYITKCIKDLNLIIYDDPFAFIYGLLFFRDRKRFHNRLWALEMWSNQLPLKSFKNIIRFIIFFITEYISFALADSIVFPSKSRLLFISNRFKSLSILEKSTVVFNYPKIEKQYAKLETARQNKLIHFRKKINNIVIYAGSLQEGRLLEDLINDTRWNSNVGLLICGSGPLEPSVQNSAKKNKSILFLGNLSKFELNTVYEMADIGILSYSNESLNTFYCAPVKLWEYMHFNLRIIGNNNYGLKNDWKPYIESFYNSPHDIFKLAEASNNSIDFPTHIKFDIDNIFEY